jgi:hypothetical protein
MSHMTRWSRRKLAVSLSALAVLASLTVGGAAWAAQPTTRATSVSRAATLILTPDTGASHRLFVIGSSVLSAVCFRTPDYPNTIWSKVSVRGGTSGAKVVTPEGTVVALKPGKGEAFMVIPATEVGGTDRGGITHFAVFDGGGIAASGTSSILIEPSVPRCTITAHFAG